MAYARYGMSCDWYVYWESTAKDAATAAAWHPKPKSQETLVIAHVDHHDVTPRFTYSQVRAMLSSGDFTLIPGFQESSRTLLSECMTEFCKEVDQEHDRTV